jgi:hypothetical protein
MRMGRLSDLGVARARRRVPDVARPRADLLLHLDGGRDLRADRAAPRWPLPERALRLGAVFAAAALAFGLAGFYNLPLRDYASFSIRGGGADGGVGMTYATGWSMAPYELPRWCSRAGPDSAARPTGAACRSPTIPTRTSA